jgi:hypothetical protein
VSNISATYCAHSCGKWLIAGLRTLQYDDMKAELMEADYEDGRRKKVMA